MGLLPLLFQNPAGFLILTIPLIYSVILHEIAHGWSAAMFGDNTARYSGRLSLHPKDHIDPVGAMAMLFFGFGWAKPVPVNYENLKPRRAGLICVAFAGPATNILIAVAAVFLMNIPALASNHLFGPVLFVAARINIALGAFNLIPVPPLDGSKILIAMLPRQAGRFLAGIEPYGFFILIALIMTRSLEPVIEFIQALIIVFIGLLLRV